MSLRATALLTSAGLGLLALAGSALGGPHPLLVYNPTPSAPLGFYTVSPPRDLHVGDIVIVAVPPAYGQLVTERRYIDLFDRQRPTSRCGRRWPGSSLSGSPPWRMGWGALTGRLIRRVCLCSGGGVPW